ncbi:Pancreatic progenitor cell differentiation and proliferation factor [Pteropus alecto]|uniref:Pancreatic progenitor cell differentiation and proliferation factor n=1 Tax=Pteropus alecto TaxID=9402 RepID=L5KVK2_PTEAL|nr:Pancreatic progenitor cell differentiation and proliferation factor [Pteropus alecto]
MAIKSVYPTPRIALVERPPAVSSANGLRRPALPSPVRAEAREGPPPRFPPAHKQEHGSRPLQQLLVATHDYYPRCLGSASSNSSCGSAQCPREAISHHPGLPKAAPNHWWAGFFFGKSMLPFVATVLKSLEHSQSPRASGSMISCDLAQGATRKQPGGQPSKTNSGPPP